MMHPPTLHSSVVSRIHLCRGVAFLLLGVVASCGAPNKKAAESEQKVALGEDGRGQGHRPKTPNVDGDEPQDGMEVQGLKGYLDPVDIQQGITPHTTALSACFSDGTKTARHIGGKLELQFTVATSGDVAKVQVFTSDIGAWDVEKCLLNVGRQMTFAKPKGGDAVFTLPLSFEATRPVLWWSADKAQSEVKTLLGQLRECNDGKPAPQDLWVTLYLGNKGVVESVGFASKHKSGFSDTWADCAVTTITAWELSDPRGQIAKLSFRYPR